MKINRVILILLFSMNASAAERGFYSSVSAAGGINPYAASVSADMFYRLPLFSDTGDMWNTSCIDLGLNGTVTPADYSGSVFLNIEPVAVFNIKFTATAQRYYTGLGYGYNRMESPDSDYSSSARDDIDNESRTAYKYSAEPALKFKYSRTVFVNKFTLNYIDTRTGDEYYYEPYSDSIHKRKDYDYSNSTNLLFEVNRNFYAGFNNFYSRTKSVDCSSNRVAGIIIFNPELQGNEKVSIGAMAGTYTANNNYRGDLFAAVFASVSMKAD
ncbi:MAG TPA: hypothetical protein P5120_05165 [Spirochaetota bacterium]|nr:hypothetical protein [Spirochaetota bacterium]HRX46888.1 hypothetical protein [Spirochaetota bacterium]